MIAGAVEPGAEGRGTHGGNARAAWLRIAGVVATATVLGSCADKGFAPPQRFSPKLTLQVSTFASQQVGFGPKFVLVAALYRVSRQNGDDFVPLAFKYFPVGNGQLNVTLPVDISPCLADNARLGAKDGCSMYVAAVLMPDTVSLADTSDADPLSNAFDYAFPVGPFVVGTGRAPTIPPIDLSATRFGVVRWEGDEALRPGGKQSVFSPTGPTSGVPTTGGSAALFVPIAGTPYPATGFQPVQGVYPGIAIFEGGVWRRYYATANTQGTGGFLAVAPFAVNDVYATGRSGLFHFDGSGFSRVSAVNDSLFSAGVVTNGSTKLVIAGATGAVWIGNTQTWTRYALSPAQRIDGGVCITGPNEAFAASLEGGLWRFNGSSWTFVPAVQTTAKFGLQCPAPGQAFVLSQGASGGLLRWTGTGWAGVGGAGLNPARLITWGVVSPTEIYAFGDSALTDRAFYRFNGTSWTEVGRTRFVQSSLLGGIMWADPRGGAAYLVSSFGRVERVTPAGVSVLSYQPALRDVMVTSATSAFAVGWNMFLARWDGTSWTVDPPPPATPTVRVLQGVWSDGPRNAWAVGNASTILRFDGTLWSVVSDALRPVATSDNYNAVWGAGASVWIVGDNSILRCSAPTTCVSESSGGSGTLYSIWGTADASTKFAVGASGRIIRSLSGGPWQAMPSPTTRTLVRVSGTGAGDVWAAGDSVLLHYDGAQWTSVPATDDLGHLLSRAPSSLQAVFQLGLWARSPKEVYFGGDFGMARWDGTRWFEIRSVDYPRRILAISGASGGCALAVTEGQTDLPSPTLWRGVGPSGCFVAPMAGPKNWP